MARTTVSGLLVFASLIAFPSSASAEGSGGAPGRQSAEEAWWTGPITISTAQTLPKGHWFLQPYLFTTISDGKYRVGSITYIQYGLLESFSIGLLPSMWRVKRSGRYKVVAGDVTLLTQLGLTKVGREGEQPGIAFVLQRTIPVGAHDKLGPDDEASDRERKRPRSA